MSQPQLTVKRAEIAEASSSFLGQSLPFGLPREELAKLQRPNDLTGSLIHPAHALRCPSQSGDLKVKCPSKRTLNVNGPLISALFTVFVIVIVKKNINVIFILNT